LRINVKSKLVSTLVVIVFFLSACAPATTLSVIEAESPVEIEAIVEVQPMTDECLACHIDKQRLIDTAKPEVVAEKESTGAG